MKKLLIGLMVLVTASAFAQQNVDEVDSAKSKIEVLEEGELSIDMSEYLQEETFNSATPILSKNGKATSYFLQREDGSSVILGVTDEAANPLKGIFNAYIGYQTIFGARAGIEIANSVEFGIHTSTTGTGVFIDQKKRTGAHLNVKFRPFAQSDIRLYTGARYNKFIKKSLGYGNYSTELQGNTLELLLGVSAEFGERHMLGFEVGYETSISGLDEYEYGVTKIDSGVNYQAPVARVTYTYRLFRKRR